jgi:hypothetical protein
MYIFGHVASLGYWNIVSQAIPEVCFTLAARRTDKPVHFSRILCTCPVDVLSSEVYELRVAACKFSSSFLITKAVVDFHDGVANGCNWSIAIL